MTLFQIRQSFLLLVTAVIWGCTFVAQALGMDHVGPFTFTASRMCLGTLFLLPIIFWKRRALLSHNKAEYIRRSSPAYRKALLMGSVLCGLCLFGGEALQQFGLVNDTEVGKSGFITALYIILVPMMGILIGKKTTPLVWVAVAVAIAGLWFLCIPPEGFSVSLGDTYTFLCAVVFSIHIFVISAFVTKVDGVELAAGQFASGSIWALIATFLFETPTVEAWIAAFPAILWAGVMSNGIAYTLQIIGQRGMNETVASLILSLESVVAVLAGWLLLNQVLSERELFGAALMAAAVVLAQLPLPGKKTA